MWVSSGFLPGDILLFDFDGSSTKLEHAGICIDSGGSKLMIVEGNTSAEDNANGGEVMERARSVSLVAGAYRPPYDGATSQPARELGADTYTVRSGDSLSKIAKKLLGNANRWPELYELNRDTIGDNPNVIYAGQILVLP
jgi:nucleoid-associated protein YgaU